MVFPYFLLDFKDKKENILCNYFRIAPFRYTANKTIHYEEILTSDKFKTREEYYTYLSDNNITTIETRYLQDTHNISNPIGTILFDFLDADLSDTTFLKKSTLKYGSSALHTSTDSMDDFEVEINGYNNNESQYEPSYEIEIFDDILNAYSKIELEEYQNFQKELRKAINFTYNLNNLSYLNDLSPAQRLFIHNVKRTTQEKMMYSYLDTISLSYTLNFPEFSKTIASYSELEPDKIAKELKKNSKKANQPLIKTFFYSFPCILSAYYFSFVYFVENNIPIKICKNCGKYFIPENRSSSVYCNRLYKDKKTCKEIGANIAYNEKLKKDEVNTLYRKILSAKKMLANRNPDIPMYLEKYEKWKAEANQFKKDIKSGIKTQEQFKEWLENTRK